MSERTVSGLWPAAAVVLCVTTTGGCGYRVGSMHPDGVHTVYVPVFTTKEYRRELEFALTEAVIKEIEQATPYKVVKRHQADTTLVGTVLELNKAVSSINPDSDPRELRVTLTAEVQWQDLRSGKTLLDGAGPSGKRRVSESVRYVPELGESLTTASNRAVKRLARRIVEMMETSW